jgi:hypothetical protein
MDLKKLVKSFLNGTSDISDNARLAEIERAMQIGPEEVIRIMNIDVNAFNEFRAELLQVYGNSGIDTIAGQTWRYPNGARAVVRWNTLSPRVETYARERIGGLIQNITSETIGNVRNTIADGYALGRSRNRIATDLIGRLQDGKRIGGVIGISDQQRVWVNGGFVKDADGVLIWRDGMRQHLRNDPKRALEYTKRDRRFDKLIKSSVATGKPLSLAQIDRITAQYSDKLLKSRGLTIARTEAARAVEEGKYEAWKQALEKTGIPEQFVIRTWNHRGRGVKDRPSHVAMNGRSVRGLTFPFVLNDGTAMLTPHDTTYGAGPNHVINCDCVADYSIDRKGIASWRG